MAAVLPLSMPFTAGLFNKKPAPASATLPPLELYLVTGHAAHDGLVDYYLTKVPEYTSADPPGAWLTEQLLVPAVRFDRTPRYGDLVYQDDADRFHWIASRHMGDDIAKIELSQTPLETMIEQQRLRNKMERIASAQYRAKW